MQSDISLIEVAGEDDSLLQQIPEDDVLNLDSDAERNSGYFLCSPLLTVRSDGSNAVSSTAHTDCTDKENINANTLEVPKLSIVPQSMKRKKKVGGYNLRKSLAWNTAFFTEEGVLNPRELSVITGSTYRGDAFSAIDEGTSAISDGDCYNDLSSEDKLLKDPTSAPVSARKNGRGLLKRGALTKDIPASAVKLKKPSAKEANQGGSKRGICPQPVASLSAKRPATLKATKTANREEKVSRIPVPKRDPTVLSRIPRSATIRASDPKGNQVAQRVGNNPKKTALKGAFINTKSAPNKNVNASKSLKAKTSIQQPKKKMASPVLKMDSSHPQHEPASDSGKALQVAAHSEFSKFPHLNDHEGIKKISGSIPHNAPPDVGNVLNQIQMAKPSGLRMPSPSMGFFVQKKVAPFQSPLPSTSRPQDLSKYDILNSKSAGPSNPIRELAPHVQRNIKKAGNGDASRESSAISCSSSGSSIGPSRDRVNSIPEAIDMRQAEVNVVVATTMNKDMSAHAMENPDVLRPSNSMLRREDFSGVYDVVDIDEQLEEREPCHVSPNNFDGSPRSNVGDMNNLGSQSMPGLLEDQLSRVQHVREQSLEQAECANSSDRTFEQISTGNQRLGTKACNSLKRSRTSTDFGHDRFEENDSNGSHARERCPSDKDVYDGQDDALETHKMRILPTRDAEAPDIDRHISNECNNTVQRTFQLYSLDSMQIDDEKPKVSMSNCSPSQFDAPHSNVVFAGESNGLRGNESNSDIDHCLIPYPAADVCLNSGLVFENCNNHTNKVVDNDGDLAMAYNMDDAESSPIHGDLCTIDIDNQLHEVQSCAGLEHENEDKAHVLPAVEYQKRCNDLVESLQHNKEGQCLNDDLLHTSDASEEYIDEIISEETNNARMDDGILETLVIEAPITSSKCSTAKSSKYDEVQSGEGASVAMSKEITSEAGTTSNDSAFCAGTEMCRESVHQNTEAKELESHDAPQNNGNTASEIENALDSEVQQLINTEMCSTDDSNAKARLEKCDDVRKQNNLVIKTSTNAVPFSDEWLAAIEAAGEEILTIKSGAVQNSPPDKTQPEPGPWSPVKRKNNQGIGPFDCTKCTNNGQAS